MLHTTEGVWNAQQVRGERSMNESSMNDDVT